ncbi:MAG TPA: redoxin [Nitrospiraceae bacterium]|nr:redoxin [Nitrospiraceae bacterium]
MIKKNFLFLLIIVICLSFTDFLALADKFKPLKEGDELPLIQLPTPETLEERNYLGNDEEGFFIIPKIEANVVIVYFFSFYCRFCAAQAVHLKELYNAIDKNPDLKKKIKFLGIGIGNTPMEVDAYKEANRIPFPLIPDTDFSVHKAYGEIMTPYFIVIRIKEDGTHRVIYSTYAFDDVNAFLKLILKKSELAQ